MVSSPERIAELEKTPAMGDIARASKAIIGIQDRWSEFDEAMHKDLKTLEAVYLSMVQRVARSKRDG